MTEPIVTVVKRYGCPTCGRTASRPGRAREHMARCWANPDNRACKTCKHFEPMNAYDPDYCDAGENLHLDPKDLDYGPDPDNPGRTYLRVHCPKWEPEAES